MSNALSRRALVIAGSAAVALAVAGCSSPVAPRASFSPPPPLGDAGPAQTLFETHEPQTPQAGVNIFGEFGHQPGPAPRLGPGGFEQVTFLEEGYDTDVEVSPDGKWLAFASTRHNERPEIYLQRVGGLSVTQLTTDQADDAFPTFSPDGRKVAFSSTRSGNWDIFVMDTDGKNVVQLTSSTMQELHPSFSPCGTRLAYCATGTRSGQWELWTIDLRSMEKSMIGYGLFPSWSPRKDKDQIAFQRARQRGGRWFSVWTVDLVGGEPRNMTEVAVSGNAAVVSPAWSADGSMIAFSTIVNPGINRGGRSGSQQDIWVINADGTGRRRITDGAGVNATPSWSKDGRVFFVSDRGGADSVWSARVGGPAVMTAEQNRHDDPFANSDKDEVGN